MGDERIDGCWVEVVGQFGDGAAAGVHMALFAISTAPEPIREIAGIADEAHSCKQYDRIGEGPNGPWPSDPAAIHI